MARCTLSMISIATISNIKRSTMDESIGIQAFAIPILKVHELVDLLEEIGVQLTREELDDPARHKEKLRKVWVAMVRAVVYKRKESLAYFQSSLF